MASGRRRSHVASGGSRLERCEARGAVKLRDEMSRRTSRISERFGALMKPRELGLLVLLVIGLMSSAAFAHGVADGDKAYIETSSGALPIPFAYLGAKHMVTGYDHLLFLVGVIFYLYRLKDVATYVTLFAVGHSLTLILGVLFHVGANAYLIDAVIGLSVVYKALDNLDVFERRLGVRPNAKLATLVFGLFHGLGLATKIIEFDMSPEGLVTNLVAFNVGVEMGQLLALSAILIGMGFWRRTPSFAAHARSANLALLLAGALLTGLKIFGYATDEG